MNPIVTICRQHGSGRHEVGRRLSGQLKIPCYDREIIEHAAKDSLRNIKAFEQADTSGVGSLLYQLSESLAAEVRRGDSLDSKIYQAQRLAVLKMAAKGPCVIVGRGGCEVLKGHVPCCAHSSTQTWKRG